MATVVGMHGDKGNHLERCGPVTGVTGLSGGVAIVPSSEQVRFPRANLYDRQVSKPFRFLSGLEDTNKLDVDDFIRFDFNVVDNGGFERTIDPLTGLPVTLDGWTEHSEGAGNVCSETTVAGQFNGGARALKMVIASTSGQASRRKDVKVRSGEYVNITVALRGDGTRVSRFKVQILETKQWVLSDGTLTTTETDFATQTAATYATIRTSTPALMPAFTASRSDLLTLRLQPYLNGDAVGEGFADDIYVWPSTDFLSVHGHNIDPRITVELRRDDAAFAGSGVVSGPFTIGDSHAGGTAPLRADPATSAVGGTLEGGVPLVIYQPSFF